MSVIDSHHHFWIEQRRPHNNFPPSFGEVLKRDFMPEDLMPEMRRARIDGTVLVQSLNDFDETLEYIEIAHQYDFVRGVVGWFPMDDPAACARALERVSPHRKFVGVRHLNNYEPDPNWIKQPRVMECIALLGKSNLVFEAVPVTAEQLDAFLHVSERNAGMRFNLNHMGRPPIPEQGWEPWASQMKRAAENPNVSVKLSIGGDIAGRWKWKIDEVRRYSDHVLSTFGANRVMIGSNWPVTLISGTFAQVWSGLEDLIGELSDKDFDAVMGGTVEKLYGLNRVTATA